MERYNRTSTTTLRYAVLAWVVMTLLGIRMAGLPLGSGLGLGDHLSAWWKAGLLVCCQLRCACYHKSVNIHMHSRFPKCRKGSSVRYRVTQKEQPNVVSMPVV